jgi:hypothetical protein
VADCCQSYDGAVRILVRALNRITVALGAAGGVLILIALITLPVLGNGAATIAAVGTWSLSLAALTAGLLVLTAVLMRVASRQWYWGESPRGAFSRTGWTFVAMATVAVVIVVIVLG